MTRGLYPPESLSKDDVYALRHVRKDIWSQGMIGGGFGACTGLILYTGAHNAKKFLGILPNAQFNRNTAMLAVFSSFAIGTFLFASTTGKEEVHKLHSVFRAGATNDEPQLNDQYNAVGGGGSVVDASRLQQMRMTRRKTVMDKIQRGQGLSDSHSGRWVEDNTETKFQKE